MNDTNNSSSICWQPDWFFDVGNKFNYIQNNIILPIYATLGLFGHIICSSVFVKQVKNEKAYVYQIFLEVTECLDNLAFSMFLLTNLASGFFCGGLQWYQKNYFLMWYTAHLALPLAHATAVSCLLLAVSMAADRAFALHKPFIYKNINHKVHQLVALVASLSLGFGSTFYNTGLFNVLSGEGDTYIISVGEDFVDSLTGKVLANVCNFTRMFGLLALIGCNISILRSFRKHLNQKSKLAATRSTIHEKKREAKDRTTERSLILLTVGRSLFTAIAMFSYVMFYTAVSAVPLFMACDSILYGPLLDVVLMLCDLGKTCVIFGLNPKSWKVLVKALCFTKWNNVKVASIIDTSNL